MGCNTSSEAKPTKEDAKGDANHKEKEPAEESKPPASEDQAATKIQAVFRGHKTRKTMSMKQAAQSKKPEPEPTRAELEAEFRADDKELCSAATKIQASFRGHQSRKQGEQDAKEAKDKDKVSGTPLTEYVKEPALEEELDIDLTDPELNKAATKIQASFRGHKVRKEVDN